MKPQYYKVLKRTGEGQLVSAYTDAEDWCVVYPELQEEQWAKPQMVNSKLFVYTGLKQAKLWMDKETEELWRVRPEGVEKLRHSLSLSVCYWQRYWEDPGVFSFGAHTPCYTVIADRVLLVERVEVE